MRYMYRFLKLSVTVSNEKRCTMNILRLRKVLGCAVLWSSDFWFYYENSKLDTLTNREVRMVRITQDNKRFPMSNTPLPSRNQTEVHLLGV